MNAVLMEFMKMFTEKPGKTTLVEYQISLKPGYLIHRVRS